ncbi:hypothetical protein J3P89_19220 [Pseudomonas sp. Z1-14]|uniref:phage head spike fiber domain-containing protein n=1 Tax=Pseudomonas sp. Z1-14 TaxID=2817409 RepID=UPI003DA9DA9A
MYFNSAGLMVQAGANEPRFECSPDTLLPLGLKMEPARTNTLTYSQDFSNSAWVKTRSTIEISGPAPDGSATACKLIVNNATGSSYLYRAGIAWTAGNSYSFSVFAKADSQSFLYLTFPAAAFGVGQQVNFQLSGEGAFVIAAGTGLASIQKLPGGWYRCSMTVTATTTAAAANWIAIQQPVVLNNSIFIWGAQLEVGAWHSSYIPTTAATAARAADAAFLGSLSPWHRFDEGTLYTEVVSNTSGFSASIGTTVGAGPRIANWRTSTSASSQIIDDAGTAVFAQAFGLVSPGQVIKQAVAFKLDDMQAASNGVAGVIDTSGAPPITVTRLALGARGTATDQISGHIRKVKFFPYRLSGPELQAITT